MADAGFMRRAISEAEKGIAKGQAPFGACVTKYGKVIAVAHNEVWKRTDITAHAEILAIQRACKKLKAVDLSNCAIYSTTEPCPMCYSAIHWAKVGKIFYGTRITDATEAGFHEMPIPDSLLKRLDDDEVEIAGDFLRAECLELFRKWRETKKQRIY